MSLINWSEDMKTPLVDGGLNNYTNWFFQVRNIVVSEQRLIEQEETKKQREEMNKNKKSSVPKGKMQKARRK